ncbi:MAG TPA: sugar phosphate nucleotidyltransferase, partial [Steroidobacteraceae bacterium]|nr:sugar phosphate nucleotidyltransferase [Steroidobacteraceae bacterium]
ALVSMGIYLFSTKRLIGELEADAADAGSAHDFGRNIVPDSIEKLQVFAYPFQDVRTRAQSYWRDVGSVDAYYQANMELVTVNPELNIYDQQWPIWTYQLQQPPAKFVLDQDGRRGMAVNSMVAGGAIISGAYVGQSLLFSNVRVEERSHLESAVILPDVEIGQGCVIRRAILDEGCEIPDNTHIGVDGAADAQRFYVTERGVVLVTPDMLREAEA